MNTKPRTNTVKLRLLDPETLPDGSIIQTIWMINSCGHRVNKYSGDLREKSVNQILEEAAEYALGSRRNFLYNYENI